MWLEKACVPLPGSPAGFSTEPGCLCCWLFVTVTYHNQPAAQLVQRRLWRCCPARPAPACPALGQHPSLASTGFQGWCTQTWPLVQASPHMQGQIPAGQMRQRRSEEALWPPQPHGPRGGTDFLALPLSLAHTLRQQTFAWFMHIVRLSRRQLGARRDCLLSTS